MQFEKKNHIFFSDFVNFNDCIRKITSKSIVWLYMITCVYQLYMNISSVYSKSYFKLIKKGLLLMKRREIQGLWREFELLTRFSERIFFNPMRFTGFNFWRLIQVRGKVAYWWNKANYNLMYHHHLDRHWQPPEQFLQNYL